MSRYGGHRIPDYYSDDWEKHGMPEYYQWWHLGYEDGVSNTKFDYDIDNNTTESTKGETELEKLRKENKSLRSWIEANIRVMKKEIQKELEVEIEDAKSL